LLGGFGERTRAFVFHRANHERVLREFADGFGDGGGLGFIAVGVESAVDQKFVVVERENGEAAGDGQLEWPGQRMEDWLPAKWPLETTSTCLRKA